MFGESFNSILIYFPQIYLNFCPAGYEFYTDDCASVGLVPLQENWEMMTEDLPNFNEMEQNRAFLQDEILRELEFKVANIALYYGNQDKLIEHIKEVNL